MQALLSGPRPNLNIMTKVAPETIDEIGRVSEAACLLGAPHVCQIRGFMITPDQLDWLERVEPATEALYEQFIAACETGDAAACGQAGDLAFSPTPESNQIDETKLELLMLGCTKANYGCDTLDATLRRFARWPDESKPVVASAMTRLKTACNAGNAVACGTLHDATPRHVTTRAALQTKACSMGHAASCIARAQATFSEFRKTPDDTALLKSATDGFSRACDLGNQIACHTLEHLPAN